MARKSTISDTKTFTIELNGNKTLIRVYCGYDFKRDRYNVRISANGELLRTYYPADITISAEGDDIRKRATNILSAALSVSNGKGGVLSYAEYYNRYCEKDPIGSREEYLSNKGNFLKLTKMFGGYEGVSLAMLLIHDPNYFG